MPLVGLITISRAQNLFWLKVFPQTFFFIIQTLFVALFGNELYLWIHA